MCLPFFHRWGPWADVGNAKGGHILIQERRCTSCNKAARRQTMWLAGDDLDRMTWESPQ